MRSRSACLLPVLVLLAGCAGLGPPDSAPPRAPVFREPGLTVEGAARALAVGSDKRSVEERLGPAERLAFASGWEVWVYRGPEAARGADGPELVLLFDPAERLRRIRARGSD
ncbi:hypothetical protein JI739_11115 [Ramlibacter sp. AW1]|uniref:Lipoprotein SmpA/OmlA domain-containing protein n=1 Tax=Ramlibacter aurantiacus TaxID=2801330 RepID=A0A936ZQX8_9BURK|nr:hypothetical protein [Ramlibacter aurantiacus]MBL0420896.1 hypothetical protein [Ramlibacter aurantiacus]